MIFTEYWQWLLTTPKLDEAKTLAEETLRQQMRLLLHMADYLSDNQSLSPEIAREMLQKYSSSFDSSSIIENGDLLFYRSALKEGLKNMEAVCDKKQRSPQRYSVITMNRKKNNRK